jgi:hypothetical protein
VKRRLQAVTTIVAGTTGNPDPPAVRGNRHGELGHRHSSALHQCVKWQGGLRQAFHAARCLNAVQGVALAEVNFLHRD